MNLFVSAMRTLVPMLAGWVLSVAQVLGVDADSTAVAGGVSVALAAVYYALLRVVEAGAERLGWEPVRMIAGVLLGWARPPEYESTLGTARVKLQVDRDAFAREVEALAEIASRRAPRDMS